MNEWEKHASLALRRGEVEVISTYARQKRIREGLTDEMLDRRLRGVARGLQRRQGQHPRDRVIPRRTSSERAGPRRTAPARRRRRRS